MGRDFDNINKKGSVLLFKYEDVIEEFYIEVWYQILNAEKRMTFPASALAGCEEWAVSPQTTCTGKGPGWG